VFHAAARMRGQLYDFNVCAPRANLPGRKNEIGRRGDPHRFVVLSKRWIVPRALAWISNHRLACDFDRSERRAINAYWPRPWRVNAAGTALTKEGRESRMARK
jgi:hypothetical protein